MNKVKSITDNDQRKLVSELCLLYFVQKKSKQPPFVEVFSKQESLAKFP